jgi:hypothetical protein
MKIQKFTAQFRIAFLFESGQKVGGDIKVVALKCFSVFVCVHLGRSKYSLVPKLFCDSQLGHQQNKLFVSYHTLSINLHYSGI